LNPSSIYQFLIVDANTLQISSLPSGFSSTGTDIHTFTPQFRYTNSTTIGYNSQPTASNQIMLGDTNVTEVSSVNANFVGATFNDLELFLQTSISANNIGIGTNALTDNTGTNVTAIGTDAFRGSGADGVAIGYQTGQNNSGWRTVL